MSPPGSPPPSPVGFTVLAVLAGIAVGVARGGRLRYLSDRSLRAWPLLIAGVAVQAVSAHVGGWPGYALLLASYVLLLAFAAANLHMVGMALIGIGLLMNLATIAVNHGMPVRASAIVAARIASADEVDRLKIASKHHLERPSDKLLLISDIIPVRPLHEVLSFGDLVLSFGVADTVVHLLRPPKRHAADPAAL